MTERLLLVSSIHIDAPQSRFLTSLFPSIRDDLQIISSFNAHMLPRVLEKQIESHTTTMIHENPEELNNENNNDNKGIATQTVLITKALAEITQDRQCTYNVTLRRVHETTAVVEKQ
jgi:hypothetical protein